MLTYRVGSAGGLSGARAMTAHLMEPTLPPEMAQLAAYYACTPGASTMPSEAFTVTVPRVREDLDPGLARLLGIDPRQPPDADGIAHLLAGHRADGTPIPGRTARPAILSLAEETGLPADRLPNVAEVEHVFAGRHAMTGDPLPAGRVGTLRARTLRLFGATETTAAGEVLDALAQGRRADGAPLRPTAYRDTVTASRTAVGYMDLCFSADKSVSIATLMAPTAAERAALHAVHREAVAETMRAIGAVLGRARRGKGGRGGTEAGRLAWLTFDHWTSRPTVEIPDRDASTGEAYSHLAVVRAAGTPQVHTHVCVPAVVLTPSGHVGAPDLAELRGRLHEWGALYQANIATGLRRLGVAVDLDPDTGAARVRAVPEAVRAAFSRRTSQGEAAARAYAAAQGLSWDALDARRRIGLLKAGVQGNPKAPKVDDVADVESWHREAAALGWHPAGVSNLDRPIPLQPRGERLAIARAAAAPFLERDFLEDAVLDGSAARIAAARGLVASGVEDASEIDDVAAALVAGGIQDAGAHVSVIVREVRGQRGRPENRLTTAAHVARETRLVDLARSAAADRSGALTVEEVEAAATASGLVFTGTHGASQAAAMRTIGTGGRVQVLVGSAGAGKTTLLRPLVSAWTARGRRVHGTAIAWRQAQALAEAGIPQEQCLAVAALLARVRSGALQLGPEDVLLLDEVSLASARDAVALLEMREASGCQLVAIGDPLQGRSVEAGGVIGLLTRALDGAVAEVSTTVRQRATQERALAGLARAGRAADVVDTLREEGRARLAPGTRADAATAAAGLWWERVQAVGEDRVLMVAPTQADARAVAEAMRRRRQAEGTRGPEVACLDAVDQAGAVFELPVALGDKIRLFRRTYGRGAGRGAIGVNGSLLTVRGVERAGLVLRATSGREALVPWTALRDRETGKILIGQGDCLTVDSAQGATAEECILALPRGSEGMDAARFYVAASRHRSRSWVVLGESAERRAVAGRRPLGDARPVRPTDLWSHAAATFSRRPASETALDLMERAHVARRAAEDVFRLGLMRIETRRARGEAPTILPAQARRRVLARALVPLERRVRARVQMLADLAARAAVIAAHIRRVAEVESARKTPGIPRRPRRGAPAPRP
ncbi:TrwC relaxase [Methylobacterium sp. 190mf]|uniref:MobF family relaxase n=1 Tax=Methylobacterium sp. 190mf TaxID=1761798 RepID=UPI00089E74A2|nr:MobF family relaxase [Methylobacterium sp. 190mf]SEG69601.1 TrwC relaxase [Methylobacterium sp. 190mf]